MWFSRQPNVKKLLERRDVDGLIEALRSKNNPEAAREILAVLEQVGDERALPELISLIGNIQYELCQFAREAVLAIVKRATLPMAISEHLSTNMLEAWKRGEDKDKVVLLELSEAAGPPWNCRLAIMGLAEWSRDVGLDEWYRTLRINCLRVLRSTSDKQVISESLRACKIDLQQLLLSIIKNKDTDVLDFLLDSVVDCNTHFEANETLLHWAVLYGRIEVVQLLLRHGANPNVHKNLGASPLHFAAREGEDRIVELLIDGGADPNIRNEEGNTPLHEAAWEGKKEAAEQLIAKGANLESKNRRGESPADHAERVGRNSVAQWLRGMQPETADAGGFSKGVRPRVNDQGVKVSVFDIRSTEFRAMQDALSRGEPLHPELEKFAQELIAIHLATGIKTKDPYRKNPRAVEIGEELAKWGGGGSAGFKAMQAVHMRVAMSGVRSPDDWGARSCLESVWNGIGEWRA